MHHAAATPNIDPASYQQLQPLPPHLLLIIGDTSPHSNPAHYGRHANDARLISRNGKGLQSGSVSIIQMVDSPKVYTCISTNFNHHPNHNHNPTVSWDEMWRFNVCRSVSERTLKLSVYRKFIQILLNTCEPAGLRAILQVFFNTDIPCRQMIERSQTSWSHRRKIF